MPGMGGEQCADTLRLARARLEERLRAVNAEIRDYPQPIARCDAQLGGLLEERSRLRAELDGLAARSGG
jgi:chromosome segregation ATPase